MINNCTATGIVTGSKMYVGGLVGESSGEIHESGSIGQVNGEDHVGGLVGVNSGLISKCNSTGDVTGKFGNFPYIGGLVGENGGTIRDSYSEGAG